MYRDPMPLSTKCQNAINNCATMPLSTKCQNAINNCAITVQHAVSNQCAITDYNYTSALENFLVRFSRSVGIPSYNRSSAA